MLGDDRGHDRQLLDLVARRLTVGNELRAGEQMPAAARRRPVIDDLVDQYRPRGAGAPCLMAGLAARLAIRLLLATSRRLARRVPANSIGTTQIKRNAVTGAKVKNGSLLKAAFKGGQLPTGATGATAATGAKGDKGDPGTNGTNGATNVVVGQSAPTAVPVGVGGATTVGSATLQCLAGERVSGRPAAAMMSAAPERPAPLSWTVSQPMLAESRTAGR